MGLMLCAPVRAENLFESIFRLMSHPDPARVAPPANGMNVTVHSHVTPKGHARPTPKAAQKADKPPVLAENEKYLSSASFSQKFRASPESAQKETKEAIGYLVEHDPTLRRGDALVTQNGVVVFDPDRSRAGAFLPVNDSHVAKPLQKRLIGFVEPGVRYGSNLVALASPNARYAGVAGSGPDASAEQKVQTADGRTIRFVGGYASPDKAFLSSVRD